MIKSFRSFFLVFLVAVYVFPSAAFGFLDLPETNPYYEDAKFLKQQAIYTDDLFVPEKTISQKEFIQWLLRSEHFDPNTYTVRTKNRFLDLPVQSSDAKFIYYLVDLGAIKIPETRKFVPEAAMRHLQALRLIFFVKGVPVPKIFPKDQFGISNVRPDTAIAPVLYQALRFGMIRAEPFYPYTVLKRNEAARYLRMASEAISAGPSLTVIQLQPGGAPSDQDITGNEKFPLFRSAWDAIRQKYIKRDQIKDTNLLYGATEGLVKSLNDPYSEFSKPAENTLTQTLSGQIEGIGAVIEANEQKQIIIVAPVKGSPAESSGLLSQDIILEVNGEKMTGLTVNEAAMKIRGPAGTTVNLKILRENHTFDIEIVRAKITVPSVTISFTDDNIGILTISSFSQTTAGEFLKAVAEIANKRPKGLVVDLRNNPGGFLDTAIYLSGFFIPEGQTVVKVRYPDRIEIQKSSGTGVLSKYPIRVLVNKGSASASEILAGALQDHQIAKVIGEKSYGKGTVQEFTTFADGSSLKITVAEWLTPNDRLIEKNGVIPNIILARTIDDLRQGKDPQLDLALADLR